MSDSKRISKARLRHHAATGLFVLLVVAGALVFGLPFVGTAVPSLSQLLPATDYAPRDYRPLQDADMAELAEFANAVWEGRQPAVPRSHLGWVLSQPGEGVYVALREKGHRLAQAWEDGRTVGAALAAAIRRVRADAGVGEDEIGSESFALEINIAHGYVRVTGEPSKSPHFGRDQRGVTGLEIAEGNVRERYAPTYMLSTNRSFVGFIARFRDKYGLSEADFAQSARLRSFEADQTIVTLGGRPTATLTMRGNRVVTPEEVTLPALQRAAKLGAEWLINNTQQDGRLVYMYWPSAGKESSGNNMIRQWMATLAMEQVAARITDRSMWGLITSNIDYNLDHFYREQNGLGLIDYRGQSSLGSIALAALALREHPGRERWAKQEASLEATVMSLWNEDGSFRTFFEPKGRNDQQNYYPGEALLLWATIIAETHDRALLDKFMKSFRYYRVWHLDGRNRNPAFVPWHTEAYALVWDMTHDDELRDFIFEMNDWLLKVEQPGDVVTSADEAGRFYDPLNRFGPPHASSDGVYLEGLAEAYRIARTVHDTKRANRYRAAMMKGFRHVLQLQFADDTDMYYVPAEQKVHVRGGIRTTVYDNRIRCDNVQHNVIAMIKAIEVLRDQQ